jgi:Fe-S cluster biosynthesis and repair protein YggX
MSSRTVTCAKFKRELPGLEKPPFGGELGQRVFDSVSQDAWKMWSDDMMIKVINEYRLDMTDPKQYDALLDEMKKFLGLADGDVAEVENAERGRSGS